jgi:hypothetical protein
MFPDSSGAKTPVVPSASKPSENDEVADVIAPGSPRPGSPRPGSPRLDNSSVTPPEPHWDSVIGAATD